MTLHYLSGPVHSGKTSRLGAWVADQPPGTVGGVLSPKAGAGPPFARTFVDVRTGAAVPMDLAATDPAALRVGPYAFDPAAFAWAAARLQEAVAAPGVRWLVVDEVGPIELRGQGLDAAVRAALTADRPSLGVVLVVREGLLDAARARYGAGAAW